MIKRIYKLKAPAKINVGLRILSKRSDGFHNLETIFIPINLYDDIKLSVDTCEGSNSISVKSQPQVSKHEKKNLCYRAVEIFMNEFKIQGNYNIKIRIKKRIPVGGGLGGGSSDAATVLKGLTEYFKSVIIDTKNKSGIEEELLCLENRLKLIAVSLGSDVPFFLVNTPSYAEFRGEKLKKLKLSVEDVMILIVNPSIHIPTVWAFKEFDKMTRKDLFGDYEGDKKKLAILINKVGITRTKSSLIKILKKHGSILVNDFETVVFKKFSPVRLIKERLYKFGAVYSSMSGSGSTVYGIFSKHDKKLFKEAKNYFKLRRNRVETVYIANA